MLVEVKLWIVKPIISLRFHSKKQQNDSIRRPVLLIVNSHKQSGCAFVCPRYFENGVAPQKQLPNHIKL